MFKVGDKVIVVDGSDNEDCNLENGSTVEITGVSGDMVTIDAGPDGLLWFASRFRATDAFVGTAGPADPFALFVEENHAMIEKGLRLGIERYTLAPLSPAQMAMIAVTLTATVKWYRQIGKDVPVHELLAFLEKLTEDPE